MRTRKRLLSLLLCGAILFSLCFPSAFAEAKTIQDSGQITVNAGGLCEYHTEHTPDCGYTEGEPETPCTHTYTEDCYTEVTECVHKHNGDCYPEETESSVSGNNATPSNAEVVTPSNEANDGCYGWSAGNPMAPEAAEIGSGQHIFGTEPTVTETPAAGTEADDISVQEPVTEPTDTEVPGDTETPTVPERSTDRRTGGEVKVGTLKRNNTNGSQDAAIGGNSQLSGIETTGKKAPTIGDTLEDGYGYRSTKSKNRVWVSDEKELSRNSINNVARAYETLSKVDLSITPTSPDLSTDGISFTYDGTNKTTFTLTAVPEMNPSHGGDITHTTYQWYVNGEPITGATTNSYSFDNATQAGTFVYRVVAALDGGNPVEDRMKVKILPITGTITNKGSGGYPTAYLYGDEIEEPGRGETYFDISPGGPALEKLTWKYTWYSGDAPAGDDSNKLSGKPSDKGIYTLKIEARDGPNYIATGTVTIEIKEKTVIPEIRCTSTKSYDGTNVVKDAKIILKDQNGQEVAQSEDEVIVSAVPVYENAEAGENKQISINVSDIVLEGAEAGNYVLDAGGQTKLTTVGSITKARLTLQVEIQPLTQSVNKPVTVTVKVLDDDHHLLKADDIHLSVRGSNDPAPTLRDAGNGTFTGTFISTTTGEVSFLAKVDTVNYDSNEASGRGLTIIREVVRTALNLTATRTEITEGDEVTYTATVTKVNGSAGEPLNGRVQFYIDGEAGSNQVGTSQQIGASGDQASVTMNGSVLTVGDHTITAVFTSDTAEESRGSINTKVRAKPVETEKPAITLTDGAGGSVPGTSNSPVGSAIRRLTGAQTGDDSPVLLYAGLAGGSVLLLLIQMIVLIVRGRKKTR